MKNLRGGVGGGGVSFDTVSLNELCCFLNLSKWRLNIETSVLSEQDVELFREKRGDRLKTSVHCVDALYV